MEKIGGKRDEKRREEIKGGKTVGDSLAKKDEAKWREGHKQQSNKQQASNSAHNHNIMTTDGDGYY